MPDTVPPHLMTEARLNASKSFGLASRLPFTHPEAAAPEVRREVPIPISAPERALALVGQAVSGRQWLVLQLPGGAVRCEGEEALCRATASRLAGEEGGAFAVFQPRACARPETTVQTEEL